MGPSHSRRRYSQTSDTGISPPDIRPGERAGDYVCVPLSAAPWIRMDEQRGRDELLAWMDLRSARAAFGGEHAEWLANRSQDRSVDRRHWHQLIFYIRIFLLIAAIWPIFPLLAWLFVRGV